MIDKIKRYWLLDTNREFSELINTILDEDLIEIGDDDFLFKLTFEIEQETGESDDED